MDGFVVSSVSDVDFLVMPCVVAQRSNWIRYRCASFEGCRNHIWGIRADNTITTMGRCAKESKVLNNALAFGKLYSQVKGKDLAG